MEQSNTNQTNQIPQKITHKSFWPLFIIAVVGIVAGVLIYWFQFQLVTDYDNQSYEFKVHRRDMVKSGQQGSQMNELKK